MAISGDIVGLASLIATNAAINIGIYKYFDRRINRIYERLDEVKSDNEGRFIRKDMCQVKHDNSAANIVGLETRIEKKLDGLEKKIETLFSNILSLLKKE